MTGVLKELINRNAKRKLSVRVATQLLNKMMRLPAGENKVKIEWGEQLLQLADREGW